MLRNGARVGLAGLLVVLVACGALKNADPSEPVLDAGDDGGLPGDVRDAEVDVALPPVDARAETVRLVFVTSARVNGAFALGKASPWAAADAVCATEAIANNLSGTFVAWLSYEKDGTSFNAGTRITDGAYHLPGTIADGGAPVLVAASRAELLSTGPRVDMDRLATGERVPQDENSAVSWVWTGTIPNGTASFSSCRQWTSADASDTGGTGNARRIPQNTPADWTTLGSRPCDIPRRLYCFEK